MTGPKNLLEIEKECADRVHKIEQVKKNLVDLEKEGFIVKKKGAYSVQ